SQATASVDFTSSNLSASFGSTVTFTAAVTAAAPGVGAPTGSITFTIDSIAQAPVALDASGQAAFSTSSLQRGSHTITAAYSGDANFMPATVPLTQQIIN